MRFLVNFYTYSLVRLYVTTHLLQLQYLLTGYQSLWQKRERQINLTQNSSWPNQLVSLFSYLPIHMVIHIL